MSEWKKLTASVFCSEVTDGTHDSPKPVSVGKYLLTSKHLQEYSLDFDNAYMISQEDYDKVISRSKVDQYDILFSMIGTVGTTHRVTVPIVDFAVKNMGIFKLSGDGLKSKWLYYWLKTRESKEYINSCLSGTTQGYMTLKALRNFPISVPDPITIEKITSILSSLDDKIAVNKKICENLEAQSQALFKHWFIDFAPFKDGKFVESELGLIPEGWRVGTLGDIADFKRGKTITKSDITVGSVPVVAGGLEPAYYHNLSNTSSRVVTISGSGANAGFTRMYYQPVWASDCSFVDNATTPLLHTAYCYLLTNKKKVDALQWGAAQPHVYAKDINKLPLAIAPLDVLNQFEGLVSGMFDLVEINDKEIVRLATLRDTLLPKLMSGEIEVNDIA